jgi:hypothetical protein
VNLPVRPRLLSYRWSESSSCLLGNDHQESRTALSPSHPLAFQGHFPRIQ